MTAALREESAPRKTRGATAAALSSARGGPAVLLLVPLAFLATGLLLPLLALLRESAWNGGRWTLFANIAAYLETPGLVAALFHTLGTGCAVTLVTLVLAFVPAYALTHTRMAGKGPCRALCLLPLCVPSLFPALGLIYLFGAQGVASGWLEFSLYGPAGVVLGSIVYTLPHAVLVLTAALRDIDADVYRAAQSLGAPPLRRFFTVTLPGARYGLTSAAIVVFVLTITDFGVPKVLGGEYSMLATEIFKQVVGMQDFGMAATVSFILLLPCVPAFALDAWSRRRQRYILRGKSLNPAPAAGRDAAFTVAAWAVLALPLAVMAMVVWGSFISFWPYELGLTLANYGFGDSVYGAAPFRNSLELAACVAAIGTAAVFAGAYLSGRCKTPPWLTGPYRALALLPLAVPGTVLGLAYILAFNAPDGWPGFLAARMPGGYGGTLFLACNTVVHLYTVCHFTCAGSLARLDPHYETAGSTLGVSRPGTVRRVIIPLQRGVLADVALYLFVNALTTISAVVFLYTPDSIPASVAVLQMLDSGKTAEASAMGVLILAAALAAHGIRALVKE